MTHEHMPVLLRRIAGLRVLFTGFVLLTFAGFILFVALSPAPARDLHSLPVPPPGFILTLLFMLLLILVNAVFMWITGRRRRILRYEITTFLGL
jgi:hypothetical protein